MVTHLFVEESDTDEKFLPMKNAVSRMCDSSLSGINGSMESSINSSFCSSVTETSCRQKRTGTDFLEHIKEISTFLGKKRLFFMKADLFVLLQMF